MKPDDGKFMLRISRDLEARKAACKIFNVKETTSKQELKKAYRKAAIKYHPDKNPDDPDADKKFALIKCAYELLTTDKPCPELLEQISSWNGVPDRDKYKLDNPWGHFLWWREKFFSPDKEKKSNGGRPTCI